MVEGRTLSANDDNDNDNDGRCHNADPCNDMIELTKMVWPMGWRKKDGSVKALVPLELIRVKGETGSDIAITWMDGFFLSRVSD